MEQSKTSMDVSGEALEQDDMQDQDEKPAKPAEAEDDRNETTLEAANSEEVSEKPMDPAFAEGQAIGKTADTCGE